MDSDHHYPLVLDCYGGSVGHLPYHRWRTSWVELADHELLDLGSFHCAGHSEKAEGPTRTPQPIPAAHETAHADAKESDLSLCLSSEFNTSLLQLYALTLQ